MFAYDSPPLAHTKLGIFNSGRARRAANLVLVPFKRGKIFFFDYRYTTGRGKHSHTHNFTLALMKTAASIPDFYLRPENFLDKIGEFIGFDDIDIQGHPGFSSKYHLKSSFPEAVVSFFNNERIVAMENGPAWNVYAGGPYFVLFKKRGIVPVAAYPNYIEEVKTLLNFLNLE